ncbi:MAG: class I SAM-dependent methyltransferase, partial [Nitrospirota bacterium]
DDLNTLSPRFKHAADLGCGLGPLLPTLSKKFTSVTAVDYSQEMISSAKKSNEHLTNIAYTQADLKDLRQFHSRFDVAIAVNSILEKNLSAVRQIVVEIFRSLKKGGRLFAIMPAMEVFLYQAMLIAEKETGNGRTDRQARRRVIQIVDPEKHDFILGKVTYYGDTQKYFYRFEIQHLLKQAGFKSIELSKVLYSWETFEDAGQNKLDGELLPWDWYVTCEKN